MASDVDTDQSGSDPMPYGQVDRAVKQTAAMIGARLGVTFQHALGGLVQFWELNGDPRDLEQLIEAGKHEVVLPRETVARRFKLAMAVDTSVLDPDDLHELHIVEKREDGYRIRGMSRYFKPLLGRVTKRLAGQVGGQKSAEARRKKHGTAQPGRSGSASESASAGASESASTPTPIPRSTAEAPPNTADSGQRSAYSGHLKRESAPDSGDEFHARADAARVADGHVSEPAPRNLSTWFSSAMMKVDGDSARLWTAFERFLANDYWRGRGAPFDRFQVRWPEYASDHYGKTAAPALPQRDEPTVFVGGEVKLKLRGQG